MCWSALDPMEERISRGGRSERRKGLPLVGALLQGQYRGGPSSGTPSGGTLGIRPLAEEQEQFVAFIVRGCRAGSAKGHSLL